MKKRISCMAIFTLVVMLVLLITIPALAHSGRLDANGVHNKTSDGTYHYHRGDDRTIEYSTPQNNTTVNPAPAPTPTPTPTPTQPQSISLPPIVATPITATVLVDNKQVAFDAYRINDSNYFKLRDIAYVLNGSAKQFGVGWNGAASAIILTSGQAYTPGGNEMAAASVGSKTPMVSSAKIMLDGERVALEVYNIDESNYFKLRDIGQAIDFSVEWDGANNTIIIDTSKGYAPESSSAAGVSTITSSATSALLSEKTKNAVAFKNFTFECDSRYGVSDDSGSLTIMFIQDVSALTINAIETPPESNEFSNEFILETVITAFIGELPTLKNKTDKWHTFDNYLAKTVAGTASINNKETLIVVCSFMDTDYIYFFMLYNADLNNSVPVDEFGYILDSLKYTKTSH